MPLFNPSSGGGSTGVQTVNGKSGTAVTLAAADVGALPLGGGTLTGALHLSQQLADGVFLDDGGLVVNVKHPLYGAHGDGITDDTTAVNNAIAAAETAANNGTSTTVYFPAGVYATTSGFTGGLVIGQQPITVQGAHRDTTVLRGIGAATGGKTAVLHLYHSATVQDLTIDANALGGATKWTGCAFTAGYSQTTAGGIQPAGWVIASGGNMPTTTAGSNVVTFPTAVPGSLAVGMFIALNGAGPQPLGSNNQMPLCTTVTAILSSTTVQVATAATVAIANTVCSYGAAVNTISEINVRRVRLMGIASQTNGYLFNCSDPNTAIILGIDASGLPVFTIDKVTVEDVFVGPSWGGSLSNSAAGQEPINIQSTNKCWLRRIDQDLAYGQTQTYAAQGGNVAAATGATGTDTGRWGPNCYSVNQAWWDGCINDLSHSSSANTSCFSMDCNYGAAGINHMTNCHTLDPNNVAPVSIWQAPQITVTACVFTQRVQMLNKLVAGATTPGPAQVIHSSSTVFAGGVQLSASTMGLWGSTDDTFGQAGSGGVLPGQSGCITVASNAASGGQVLTGPLRFTSPNFTGTGFMFAAGHGAYTYQAKIVGGGMTTSQSAVGSSCTVTGPIVNHDGFTGMVPMAASAYSLLPADNGVVATLTAAKTVTVPTAVGNAGKVYTLTNASASTAALTVASVAGTVPVASVGAGTVSRIQSDGTNWQAA